MNTHRITSIIKKAAIPAAIIIIGAFIAIQTATAQDVAYATTTTTNTTFTNHVTALPTHDSSVLKCTTQAVWPGTAVPTALATTTESTQPASAHCDYGWTDTQVTNTTAAATPWVCREAHTLNLAPRQHCAETLARAMALTATWSWWAYSHNHLNNNYFGTKEASFWRTTAN